MFYYNIIDNPPMLKIIFSIALLYALVPSLYWVSEVTVLALTDLFSSMLQVMHFGAEKTNCFMEECMAQFLPVI